MLKVQERNSSNVPTVTYTRGTDLSGTLDGPGGIGGLLARSHGYSSGSWTNHNFYHADGNGNITAMVGANQTLVASYRYDPFGRGTYSSGSLAAANLYRFSSKPIQPNSGLYYYGYRFYWPELQRWITCDPIGQGGDVSLFVAFENNPITVVDALGLAPEGHAGGLVTPELACKWEEWLKLGCDDCPVKAVQDRQYQANENIIALIDWARNGKCYSTEDYLRLASGRRLATAGKSGYRSAELNKMPACIRKAVEWEEESGVLTFTSIVVTQNLAWNPLSPISWGLPWNRYGNALAANEALRQQWLSQRLSVVLRKCEQLGNQLPHSLAASEIK